MAVIRTASIVADIRGSVGDVTYSRNLGGAYVKAKWIPSGAPTQPQLDSQAALTALSQYWDTTVTEAQRICWRNYAQAHPRPGRFGDLRRTTGYHAFLRHNLPWARYTTASLIDDPPTAEPCPLPAPAATLAQATDTLTIALPCQPYDPPPAGLILYAYAARPQPAGSYNSHGVWQILELNQYTPPWTTDPWAIVLPWAIALADVVWIALRAQSSVTGAISGTVPLASHRHMTAQSDDHPERPPMEAFTNWPSGSGTTSHPRPGIGGHRPRRPAPTTAPAGRQPRTPARPLRATGPGRRRTTPTPYRTGP